MRKTVVVLSDDIDGYDLAEGQGETIAFSINEAHYLIDLGHENAERLREAIAPYTQAGRRVRAPGALVGSVTPRKRRKTPRPE